MKLWIKTSCISLWLLCIQLVLASGFSVARADTGNGSFNNTVTNFKACEAKANRLSSVALSKSDVFVLWTQQHLHTIYRHSSEFENDFAGPGHNLADGRIGPVTRKWMSRFCDDFALDTSGDDEAFATNMLDALSIIAQLRIRYDNFEDTLQSKDFLEWLSLQNDDKHTCTYKPGCFGNPPHLHKLLDRYFLAHGGEEIIHPSGLLFPAYYQFNDEDLELLTLNNETLSALNDLVGSEFTNEIEINNTLRPFVKKLTDNFEKELEKLVSSRIADKENADKENADKENADKENADKENADKENADKKSDPIYTMTATALGQMSKRLHVASLTDDQMAILQSLKGKVFAEQYLLDVALKLANMPEMTPEVQYVIAKSAQKSGEVSDVGVEPLQWYATPGCGCSAKVATGIGDQRVFYGFYPYWDEATPEQSIDFSQLTRMGYFSAALTNDRHGNNKLELPPSWKPEKPYSEFISLAHQHKTKVDLVVTNQRPSLLKDTQALNFNFGQPLIEQMVAAVKAPLEGYIINDMKPVLSFGASPRRTIGDGVTLNFDLSKMNNKASQENFKTFVKLLKQQLSWERIGSKKEDGTPRKAKISDEYYLNIMVPVEKLLAGEGFYTMENLMEIEGQVNLFIMVFEPIGEHVEHDMVKRMKQLRRFLGEKRHLAFAEQLYMKSVPMLRMNESEAYPQALDEALAYVDWSYLGLSFWTLPLHEYAQQAITKTYFDNGEEDDSGLQLIEDSAEQLCDQLCPNRWLMRLVLFALFICTFLGAVASIWIYELRGIFQTMSFTLFSVGASIFLFLVLACDPYWKEHQQLIIFIYVFAAMILIFMWRVKKNREQDFP